MAKHGGHKTLTRMPSKAQMAKDERHWRAESMVKDAFMNTPAAKQQVKQAVKTLSQAEKAIQSSIKVKPKGK